MSTSEAQFPTPLDVATSPSLAPASFTASREAFVVELGSALHAAGTPCDHLEDTLTGVADQLGLQAQFFCTPTSLMSGFGDPESQRVVLTRVQPGEPNLVRLDAIDYLAGQVARGKINVAEGRARLRSITSAPRRLTSWIDPIAFGLASATVCVFFQGSAQDIGAAAVLGVLVGAFLLVASARRRLARLMDFASGFFAAAGSVLLAAVIPGIEAKTVMISGLIVLVPGLTLTTAVSELAMRHLVAGTARFTHAIMIFVSIGFGAAIGRQFAPIWPPASDPADPVPSWLIWAALPLSPVALTVLFRAPWKDLPVVLTAAVVAFIGARFGASMLGPELGASIGALALGLFANAWARRAKRPSAIPKIPGLMLLVPGAVGFRSLTAMLEQDTAGGVATAFSMILVAASIVAGLLLAQSAYPSRQPL
ncbi:MAG: threonine/serine exporter family protein [Planctomycetota bacterium]